MVSVPNLKGITVGKFAEKKRKIRFNNREWQRELVQKAAGRQILPPFQDLWCNRRRSEGASHNDIEHETHDKRHVFQYQPEAYRPVPRGILLPLQPPSSRRAELPKSACGFGTVILIGKIWDFELWWGKGITIFQNYKKRWPRNCCRPNHQALSIQTLIAFSPRLPHREYGIAIRSQCFILGGSHE